MRRTLYLAALSSALYGKGPYQTAGDHFTSCAPAQERTRRSNDYAVASPADTAELSSNLALVTTSSGDEPTNSCFAITLPGQFLGSTSLSPPPTGLVADGSTSLTIWPISDAIGGGTHTIYLADEFGSTSPDYVGTFLERTWSDDDDVEIVTPVNPIEVDEICTGQPCSNIITGPVELRAPVDFVRPYNHSKDQDLPVRELSLRICASDDCCTGHIFLHRPPVVLVHGLWGTPGSWDWPLENDDRFVVQVADYSASNAVSVRSNVAAVREAIYWAVEQMRSKGIAATQADVVGHSMGGVLARMYASNFGQLMRRPDNFFAGDVHKLITLDSPLLGSQLANLLVNREGSATRLGRCYEGLYVGGNPVGQGAVRDLRVDSSSITRLRAEYLANGIPVAKLVGAGGGDQPYRAPASHISRLLNSACGNGNLEANVFHGDHDGIVSLNSQLGGSNSAAQFVPAPGNMHSGNEGVASSVAASNLAVDLLNESVDSSSFTRGFAPVSTMLPGPTACDYRESWICRYLSGAQAAGDAGDEPLPPIFLELVKPSGSTEIPSGSTIVVRVVGAGGLTTPECFVGTLFGDLMAVGDPDFTREIEIPSKVAGAITVGGVCYDGDRVFILEAIQLTAVPAAQLTGLRFEPDALVLTRFADSRRVALIGHYDDGIERDVSSLPSVALSSSDECVAAVEPTGLVVAAGLGYASVAASLHGLVAVIPVEVASIKFDVDDDGIVEKWEERPLLDLSCFQGPGAISEATDSELLELLHARCQYFGWKPYCNSFSCLDHFDSDRDFDVDLLDYSQLMVGLGRNCTTINDDCEGAITLVTGVPQRGTTYYTTSGSDVSSCGYRDTADSWYTWTADCTGRIEVGISYSDFNFKPTLAIYDSCGGAQVACIDNPFSSATPYTVFLRVAKGQNVVMRVAGKDGGRGSYSIRVTPPCFPEP